MAKKTRTKKTVTITAEKFTEAITDIIAEDFEEYGAEAIVMIPGVYELLAEHYNNEAIERVLEEAA